MKKITAPVPGVNGTGVGGLGFVDSVAETDNEAIIAYCRGAGYTVEDVDKEGAVEVEGVVVESDEAGTGEAANAETGEVTAPGDQLPAVEGDGPFGEQYDLPGSGYEPQA